LQFAKVSIHPRLHAIEKTKIFIDLEKAWEVEPDHQTKYLQSSMGRHK
jgi:hypothetical protein